MVGEDPSQQSQVDDDGFDESVGGNYLQMEVQLQNCRLYLQLQMEENILS